MAGGIGIPTIKWYGKEGEYNILVMNLLGPSLEDLFTFCGRRFSLKTILLLADQMLNRIEYVHSKTIVHRLVCQVLSSFKLNFVSHSERLFRFYLTRKTFQTKKNETFLNIKQGHQARQLPDGGGQEGKSGLHN